MNPVLRYSLPLSLLIFRFLTLSAEPISSFSLQLPNFDSTFTLLGDAQIANSFVNLTSPSLGSRGQIIYKKPFKFLDPKSSKPISFSTDFTFSIYPGNGDGLAFVIFPSGDDPSHVFDQRSFGISENTDSRFVAIEYDTRKDDNVGDLNGNHVGVDVGSFISAVTIDVSSVGLLLNGGVPLKSWIDYEASSKRLEIRLGESGTQRPYQPLISHSLDLPKMWGDREVLVGISSSSGKSSQISSLSSWNFNIRAFPNSMHSMPLNPDVIHADEHNVVHRRKSCFLTVLGAVIFATGCGTLVAFFVLFLWLILFGRHSSVTPELPLNAVEFKYEKVNVTIDDVSDESRT